MDEFTIFSQSWYANANRPIGFVDEISIGKCVTIRWYDLTAMVAPKLEVFDDGWLELARLECEHQFVTCLLAERCDASSTVAGFVESLIALGFVDVTVRERPADHNADPF